MSSSIKNYLERTKMYMKSYKCGMYLKNIHTDDVFKITARRPSLGGVYVRMCQQPGQIEVKGFYHVSDLVSHFRIMNKTETILYAK